MSDQKRPGISVTLLGPLEVGRGDIRLALGGTKQRSVFGVLALNVGRVVTVDRVIDLVWGEQPPNGALATLHVNISNLRRMLAGIDADSLLRSRPSGYMFDCVEEATDLGRFRSLVRQARERRSGTSNVETAALLRTALDIWRAEPLQDLVRDPLDAVRSALTAERRSVHELYLDLELAAGRHSDILGELADLVRREPLNEGMAGRLMRALYQSGRQAEALQVYQRIREVLSDELGLQPGADLRQLQTGILAQSIDSSPPLRRRGSITTTRRWQQDQLRCAYLVTALGARITLPDASFTVGRGQECDAILTHESVSRRHGVIEPSGTGHAITDLSSTNGTRVNRVLLAPGESQLLSSGDLLAFGAESFTYSIE